MVSCNMISPGEEKAWEILNSLDPSAVCKNTSVSFDKNTNSYVLKSFCIDFHINLNERSIKSTSYQGEIITKRYKYFFIHSCLWYLIHAKDIPLTGRLIKPENIKGGEMFFRGSHILPLDSVAKKFGDNRDAFINKGKELCAEIINYGDASIRVYPLPRIPTNIILWLGDEEFPPKADLLFDSSCEFHLPIDVLWSIAMLSLLVML